MRRPIEYIKMSNQTEFFPMETDNVNTVTWIGAYTEGFREPNYPLPAVKNMALWDYSTFILLANIEPMSDEEWEREEDEWQDYLDYLDFIEGRTA